MSCRSSFSFTTLPYAPLSARPAASPPGAPDGHSTAMILVAISWASPSPAITQLAVDPGREGVVPQRPLQHGGRPAAPPGALGEPREGAAGRQQPRGLG